MKTCILLMLLSLSGCAAAAPVALGTGSAVADMVLGEAIKAGAATVASELAPEVLAMAGSGLDSVARMGRGGPSLLSMLPSRRQSVRTVRGVTFVGDWW